MAQLRPGSLNHGATAAPSAYRLNAVPSLSKETSRLRSSCSLPIHDGRMNPSCPASAATVASAPVTIVVTSPSIAWS